MYSIVVSVCFLVCVSGQTSFVYENHNPGQENEECRREGGKVWLCKKVTECPTARKILNGGGTLHTCSWTAVNTHIICCPPSDAIDDRQRPSVASTKCSEYEGLLCENGVYKPSRLEQVTNAKRKKRQNFHTEVYGGMPAKPASNPYMALVGYGNADAISWQCGGTLISERFVLSAAHCSDTSYGPASWVRLGDLVLDSDMDESRPQQFEIKERIVHRGYSAPAYYNDIVLFRLDRDVVFDKFVAPACLWTLGQLEGNGVASGWGKNESSGPRSQTLQVVTLKFIPPEKCKSSVGMVPKLLPQGIDENTMICAGEPGKDTCQGDSGGPLVLESKFGGCLSKLVGVTSFGPRFCGETNIPGTYVRVQYFLPWIESVVWPT